MNNIFSAVITVEHALRILKQELSGSLKRSIKFTTGVYNFIFNIGGDRACIPVKKAASSSPASPRGY